MRRQSRRLKWKILLGWLASNGWIVAHAEVAARTPLTSTMVVQALSVRGVEVNAAHVHLPMSMVVRGLSPTLTVVGAERPAGNQLRVRLRCAKAADCLAFTATLDVESSAEADAILAVIAPSSRSEASGPAVTGLHAGDRLALSLQQGHFVARMPCVAIDTGAPGETIRVSTLDRHRIFRAIVTGPAAATGVSE